MTAAKPDITQQRAYYRRRAHRYRTAGGNYRQRMHSSFSMTATKPYIARCGNEQRVLSKYRSGIIIHPHTAILCQYATSIYSLRCYHCSLLWYTILYSSSFQSSFLSFRRRFFCRLTVFFVVSAVAFVVFHRRLGVVFAVNSPSFCRRYGRFRLCLHCCLRRHFCCLHHRFYRLSLWSLSLILSPSLSASTSFLTSFVSFLLSFLASWSSFCRLCRRYVLFTIVFVVVFIFSLRIVYNFLSYTCVHPDMAQREVINTDTRARAPRTRHSRWLLWNPISRSRALITGDVRIDIAQREVIIVSACTRHSPWQLRKPISHGVRTIIGYCAKILLTSFQSLIRCAAVVCLHQQWRHVLKIVSSTARGGDVYIIFSLRSVYNFLSYTCVHGFMFVK